MEARIQPKVISGQQLKVFGRHVTIGYMRDPKEEFSRRLNEVLDRAGFPAKGKGRQEALAKRYGVSQNGARKWLEAESIPKSTRLAEMAVDLGVTTEYLLTGRGDVYFKGDIPAQNMPEIPAEIRQLLNRATPRSYAQLIKIAEAAVDGRLSEDDVVLLEKIAERLSKNTEKER